MELLLIVALVGFLTRGTFDHAKANYAAGRDQRVKEVAKSFPKGALPKSRQRAAARQHALGWWAREVRHGFPVTKTGWHAAWLAHQTVADHHKARREEARTTALETRASVLAGMPDHRKRQAEAQAELDAIREQLAGWERLVPGVPPRGKRAVREAADEVARKRAAKGQPAAGRCPACGAPDGYEHLKDCDPSVPPLPADSVRPPVPAVIDTPVRVHNAEDSAHLKPGEPRCEGCGGTGRNGAGIAACPVCRGWGSAPPDPMSPLAAPDAVCATCGNAGKPGDPVLADPGGNIHLSHATEQQEAYWDRLNRERDPDGSAGRRHAEIDDAVIGADHGFDDEYDTHPSPTTQGAPVTADTNYTTVLTNAKAFAAQADEDATTARSRRMLAEHHLEEMQAAEVDAATLSSQMDLVEQLREAEKAAEATGEHATQVSDGLQQRHGGLKQAHDDAPVRAAQRGFYEGS